MEKDLKDVLAQKKNKQVTKLLEQIDKKNAIAILQKVDRPSKKKQKNEDNQ